jgi:predicted nucleotidyltransferase
MTITDNKYIVDKIKNIVHRYDGNAIIKLFGSRARGDYHVESDYDFLILSDWKNVEDLKDKLRHDILEEIEWKTFESIQTIVKNKKVWEDDYWVTGIYQSIKEDGIEV